MKIPKVTEEHPYIEFSFNEKGVLKFEKSSHWWGGINHSFYGSGLEGNSCYPKDLEKYIKRFKENKLKEIDKDIAELQKIKLKYESI